MNSKNYNGPDMHRHEPTPEIRAEVDDGTAILRRTNAGSANLTIDYRIADRTEQLNSTLWEGIVKIYQYEVHRMWDLMSGLEAGLTSQLSDAGREAHVTRDWSSKDSRSWQDDDTSFTVKASSNRITENLRIADGTSEVDTIRKTLALITRQREENIHQIYGGIIWDSHDRRRTMKDEKMPSRKDWLHEL